MIPSDDNEFDPVETVANVLARWDSARKRAFRRAAADKEFHRWLMRTVPELLDAARPGDPGK